MQSKVVYFRIREDSLRQVDALVATRIYKDRTHFFEVAILKELRSYDSRE